MELALAYRFRSTAPAPPSCTRSHCFCCSRLGHRTHAGREAGRGEGSAGRQDRVREALTCGGSTQHCFGQQQQSEVAVGTAHGAAEPASARRGRRSWECLVPAHGDSSGPHREVRMKFLHCSALRLNEGPQDSSCDGIKQRCMILSSASCSSCAYDSLPFAFSIPWDF